MNHMKTVLTASAFALCLLTISSTAVAAPVSCDSLGGTSVVTVSICTNGSLLFSNLEVQNILNDPGVQVSFIGSSSPLVTGSTYFLYLRPNLGGPVPQEIPLAFQVT